MDQREQDPERALLAAAPRLAAFEHLKQHARWPDGVPQWARDHNGQMNDMTAARAVIDELRQLVLGLLQQQNHVEAGESAAPSAPRQR